MSNPNEFTFDDDAVTEGTAAELAEQMPEPQQHAIEQQRAEETAAAEGVERDAAGVPFNAEIHTGSKLKSGLWRMRKGKSRVASPEGAQSAGPSKDEIAAANSAAAGAAAAGCFFMLGRGIFGEEWEPSEDEVQMHSAAWGAYFHSKQVTDFPPGIAVLVAIGSYAASRFHKPKTKARLQGIKSWVITRFAAYRMRRALKKKGISADVTIVDGKIQVTEHKAK